MRTRIAAFVAAAALFAYAYAAPGLRRWFIQDVISWDAEPTDPVPLPAGVGPRSPAFAGSLHLGPGLAAAPKVRVVLIDGLAKSTALTLPTWSSLCAQGLTLDVDVGFPTVSLPVQVSLWTGLTQQQTGVMFRADRPLIPALASSIPAQVPDSRAIAESHGYIVRSLGFASVGPARIEERPAKDIDPEGWKTLWVPAAVAAVASDARLAFVHVLRLDTTGHRKGRESPEYRTVALEADAILAQLHAAAPDARWFLLSDHGHLPRGGHGGEEPEVRQVQHCIVGPGVVPGRGLGLVHLVDVSKALADSVEAKLDPQARGRPMMVALASPLEDDQAVPALALGTGVIAIFILVLGATASAWAVRRWWLAPWWLLVAIGLLLYLRGEPTMSTPMMYAGEGKVMYHSWIAALPLAAAATWFGLGRMTLLRVLVAQLALPFAALAAAITASGGWPGLFGGEVAPVVPHYTAYTSPMFLVTAHGAAAVALAVLVRSALSEFGLLTPRETPRSAPSSD